MKSIKSIKSIKLSQVNKIKSTKSCTHRANSFIHSLSEQGQN